MLFPILLYGIDCSARTGETYEPVSRFTMDALREGYYSSVFGGYARGDAERSIID